jgi:competence protein ComEA
MGERSRGQLIGYGLAALLLVVAGFELVGNRKKDGGAGTPVAVGAGSGPAADQPASAGGERRVYIHVAGAVRRPGLYRVRASGRVAGAVARAGGPTGKADLAGVNLAAPLQDGQQVLVPAAGPGGGGASAHASGGRVSLGSASAQDLDGLDGIGPTLAKRIVDYRQSHGGFRSVDDLRGVEGIGEKRLAALRKALNP